jgi:hypothetical protein
VAIAALWVLALGAQELRATPHPGVVGEPIAIRVRSEPAVEGDERRPMAGVTLVVEVPSGERRAAGSSDGDGCVAFVPSVVGVHVFRATIDDVMHVLPVSVVAGERRWPRIAAAVPLGLALLAWVLRRWRAERRAQLG